MPETLPEDSVAGGSQSPVPQISLPKGGGAIHGIGEKFSTNAMTGTGAMSVPIAESPARSGFGPQISVTYDSGAGNGVFGIGWSLGVPSITRKTDKGLPQYRDREESDVFILSGSEDLVPVLRRGPDGAWEAERVERDGFCIHFYRPRVEGLFARIEKWMRKSDGEIHWRSFTRDNIVNIYGDSSDSRITDPTHALHTFQWLLSASHDGKGNAICYEYAAEDARNVDTTQPAERRRSVSANRYLKRILYGNRDPLPRHSHGRRNPGWMFELVFDFGDEGFRCFRDKDEACVYAGEDIENGSWPARKDPFSTYRAGFEVRTYRLCRRTLMFHHFPEELGSPRYLVRSTEFHYDEKAIGSFLIRVNQCGYTRVSKDNYRRKSLPPLELGYTPSPLEDEFPAPFELLEAEAENLPAGIDRANYRWIDLNGEGISGVLTQQDSAWYYKPNLGNGHFGPTQVVTEKPLTANLGSAYQQLLDVGGKGQVNLVELSPGSAGFYERSPAPASADGLDSGWGRFCPFRSSPVLDWKDPNLRFVDLTGDGVADLLITEDVAFRWHPSLKVEGFGPAVRIPAPTDEEEGPRVVFSDPAQTIYLADMSGDGLTDIVRIRNGEVCYWPNMGYGHFGQKVVMGGPPWFDAPGLFDGGRVRLADTDGSGTTDILYIAENAIHVYLNQSGNSLSERRILRGLPNAEASDISVVDFLGRGTACLVWSSSYPANSKRPLRYVDLMRGQKPHLLTRVANNLGAETVIEYASSTEFYLADKAEGNPWITPLPFPVHVVKRVETFDYVSRRRMVATSSYHHGYFDATEREFRGFGRVDRSDAEEFAGNHHGQLPSVLNQDAAWRVPPVLTKTWFHTGVFAGAGRISRHLAHEYYRAPGENAGMLLDDTILPGDLAPEEVREACRALKGSMLRQEVYALDRSEKSGRPYTVTESNSTVRLIQLRERNRHCVFFTHPRESLAFNYERKLYTIVDDLRADPRLAQTITLEVDEFGNVLKSADVAYGRRYPDQSGVLTDGDQAKQAESLATLTENTFTNAVNTDDAYRTPMPAESIVYELIHFEQSERRCDETPRLNFHQVQSVVSRVDNGKRDLPFEDLRAEGARDTGPYRRLVHRSRTTYRSDALDRLLPLGHVESLALAGENYSLVLTPGLIARIYQDKLAHPEKVLPGAGGYVDLDGDGHWWAPSGRIFYSPHEGDGPAAELKYAQRHFYQLHRFHDPFGSISHIKYDAHDLAPIESRDPLGNVVQAQLDYRVMQPRQVTDANGNRSEAAFDALGMVAGTVIMGKTAQPVGDSWDGFVADLPESVLLKHLQEPLVDPDKILGNATTRLLYDLFAFDRTRHAEQPQPAVTYSMVRETHVHDLPQGERTRIQHAFSYSDGFGRETQKKIQAEPGPIPGEDGRHAGPRWVGNGWTIFNNKGKPVRQFEPFFSRTHHFEFAAQVGVSTILVYDSIDRVVATLNPNHTFQKTVIDPWRQQTWDANDTVLIDPKKDPDVGGFLRSVPAEELQPTWYQQRADGGLGREEQEAAWKAAAHANTAALAFPDALGRTVVSIDHNRTPGEPGPRDEFNVTRTEFDVQGNQLAVTDPLGRVIMTYDYDVAGHKIHQNSSDAGERWNIYEVTGKPLLAFDSRDHRLRYEYDQLRRVITLFVRTMDGPEKLAERAEYGERLPEPEARNLRGKLHRQFDEAGVVTRDEYDFKGNLLKSSRQLLVDYREEVDWAAAPSLEDEIFSSETSYDALNRPITLTAPDRSVLRPAYNEANLLERLDVSLKGAAEATAFVTNIDYNAKGQRELIEYGNDARTASQYDPLTFRLSHLETMRASDTAVLQDLAYSYDPVGNICSIADAAQQTVYFKNQVVKANGNYLYDAIYRLIKAEGREHTGNPEQPETTYNDVPRVHLPLPGDGHAMRNYREQYRYDMAGNILEILHSAAGEGGWCRHYEYGEIDSNNRLTITKAGQTKEHYTYDAHGNMTRMLHLPSIAWNFKDQIASTRSQVVNGEGLAETAYYVYDSGGQRVRKVNDISGHRRAERIYLAGFEIYREYDSDRSIELERTTLHIMDDKRRVALVETRGEKTTIRYQFDNHLGSSCVELDQNASVITYEEYYPYGSTSYQAGRSAAETSLKRYRFTGEEKDEETGFTYHTARYYIPWLGRWTSSDPAGIDQGLNTYEYVSSRVTTQVDPSGLGFWGHVWGGVKTVGGGLETAAGVALIGAGAATSEIGVGFLIGAAGVAVTAHGLDTVQSGVRQTVSGEQTDTLTSEGLQAAGVSRRTANLLDTGISVVGTLGASAVTKAPTVAVAATEGSEGLVHLTTAQSAAAIDAAQTLGKGGTIYAGPASLADASGLGITVRTGLSASQATDVIRVPASAAGAFRVPAVVGPMTAWQRISGTVYSAGAGSVDLTTGALTATGPAWNQIGIYAFDATVNFGARSAPELADLGIQSITGYSDYPSASLAPGSSNQPAFGQNLLAFIDSSGTNLAPQPLIAQNTANLPVIDPTVSDPTNYPSVTPEEMEAQQCFVPRLQSVR